MRCRVFWVLGAFLTAAAAPQPAIAETMARWVQHTAGGVEARLVTDQTACPSVIVDGRSVAMRERAAPSAEFPGRVCSLALPAGTRRATVENQALPLPAATVQRIIMVGDTGCRLKDNVIQACDDPAAWPWRQVAETAASQHPDFVIHVGDYHYRETPCPAGAPCAGPYGDNWAVWDADFFAPARQLLAAAPWIMVRGNHEECARAGAGWARYLAPDQTAAPCAAHEAPYSVNIGGRSLVVFDTAIARDLRADPKDVELYRRDFAALSRLASGPSWLLTHHPLRGIVRVENGKMIGGNLTLIAAENELPASLELMLAGHIHTFQVLNYRRGPPQIIGGNGGDLLDEHVPASLSGLTVGGLEVVDGISGSGFGFLMLERGAADWTATGFDRQGNKLRRCTIAARHVVCGAP
jgi:hypothetical protein